MIELILILVLVLIISNVVAWLIIFRLVKATIILAEEIDNNNEKESNDNSTEKH